VLTRYQKFNSELSSGLFPTRRARSNIDTAGSNKQDGKLRKEMRMRKQVLLWVALVMLAGALHAIAQASRDDCNLAGTWYGGSDFKYQLTIIPTGNNRYVVTYDPVYTLDLYGFPYNTKYTGVLLRKDRKLTLNAMSILNMENTLVPPDGSKLNIWAIQQSGEIVNCNTLELVDIFGGGYYWTSDKVPLKDPPDYTLPATAPETYHRLPSPQ
jgi:hypothetical protein